MKITLDLPDALADQLLAAAAAQGWDMNNYAVAKLQQVLTEDSDEVDEDLIVALREGIAQAKAGNLRTQEQVDEAVYAAIAAHPAKALDISDASKAPA